MTTQTKHTPGPWIFAFGSVYQGDNADTVEENTGRLLHADRDNPHTTPTERDANCRLAAQAPDLLRQRDRLREALKDLEAIASLANARQHAGCDVRPDDWSELHHCTNAARAILAETEAKP